MYSEHGTHVFNVVNKTTGFTAQTLRTLRLQGESGDCDLRYYAVYTGGSGDTVIGIIVESSFDNSTWFRSAAISLVDGAKSAAGSDGDFTVGPYIRARLEVTGTAPTRLDAHAFLVFANRVVETAL